jgi:hypothetical protein
MTGLPKELITTPRLSTFKEDSENQKKIVKEHFKELLQPKEEEEETEELKSIQEGGTPPFMQKQLLALEEEKELGVQRTDQASEIREQVHKAVTGEKLEEKQLSTEALSFKTISQVLQSASTASTHQLSAELTTLFEKMASMMILMTREEKQDTTTLLVTNPASVFHGARIQIKAFTTAPMAFNISIAASDTACMLLSQHQKSLLDAFENGAFAFNVHRFEIERKDPLENRRIPNQESESQEEDV